MESTTSQRALAEFVGTFALIFIGAGSIVATGGENLVAIAIAHGLAIGTMVSAVGHVSGAHFNPAVTIGALAAGRISFADALVYIPTQLVGGIAGALVLRAAVPRAAFDAVLGGTPALTDVSTGQAILIEAVLTFFLVWVVFAVAVDPAGSFGKIAGLAIGFVITMDIFMGGPFTGAAMNPARAFGPALVGGTWTDQFVYWIGPIIGALAAALAYQHVILRDRGDATPEF